MTIAGAGFTGATLVNFGTTAAQDVVIVNDRTITAKSPAGAGIVNVTVTTPGGTSATSASTQFTYEAAVAAPRGRFAVTIRDSRAADLVGSHLQRGARRGFRPRRQ